MRDETVMLGRKGFKKIKKRTLLLCFGLVKVGDLHLKCFVSQFFML